MPYHTTEEWADIYRRCRALWIHDGNSLRPHALLSAGGHSDGFFNSKMVMQDPMLLDRAASDLLDGLVSTGFDIDAPHRVIGPAMGAITLAHDIARHIGQRRGRPCLCGYAEKTGDGKFEFRRTPITDDELLLLVEDVLTSGRSVEYLLKAVPISSSTLESVGLLVNRSTLLEIRGKKLVSLIHHPMSNWPAEECPLCKQGSTAIRSKGNWDQLNAEY